MSLPVMEAKRSGRKESQEIVTRCRPASFRGRAKWSRVAPLVVIESSTGDGPDGPTRSGKVGADRGLPTSYPDRRYAEALDEDAAPAARFPRT